MTDIRLPVTTREALRARAGVCTHLNYSDGIYHDDPDIPQQIIDWGLGLIRTRAAGSAQQRAAFETLADAGVGLYLYVGDMTYDSAKIAADIDRLAAASYAPAIVAITGPNEVNAKQDLTWPTKAAWLQECIWNEVGKHASLEHVNVVSGSLKRYVPDYWADVATYAPLVTPWCSAVEFHLYPPANVGPVMNAEEIAQLRVAYAGMPLWHGETGWTTGVPYKTEPDVAGKYTVEAYLRNYLSGVVATFIYEFADEAPHVPGREGLFGMRGKPAEDAVRRLLATPDGGEAFPGWLAIHEEGISDAQAVVRSLGGSEWDVYLLRGNDPTATLVLPGRGYKVDVGTETVGPRGNERELELLDSLTVVHVSTD